jgi:genome maintenance exonuclease 1
VIVERFTYKECPRESVDGKRHYCLPDGSKVPSVTTILDATKPQEKRDSLNEWKRRMGPARAQQITTEAANRGTRMHSYLEHYVKTGDMKPFPSNPFAQPSWLMAGDVILQGLKHVDEFWGVEIPLYYSGLYAGTTDCLGIWKGKPAIMDFKQSNKPKKREWIDDYFMQLAAYAAAHNDMHGTDIKTGVILMCVPPVINDKNEIVTAPTYLEFEVDESEFAGWSEQWFERVKQYYRM